MKELVVIGQRFIKHVINRRHHGPHLPCHHQRSGLISTSNSPTRSVPRSWARSAIPTSPPYSSRVEQRRLLRGRQRRLPWLIFSTYKNEYDGKTRRPYCPEDEEVMPIALPSEVFRGFLMGAHNGGWGHRSRAQPKICSRELIL
jgi:hypothetical protein